MLTSPVVKNVIGLIPFGVGSTANELLNKTDTMEGTMSREKLVMNILKILLYAGLLWGGVISFDQFSEVAD